jgi:cation diffusion facilitator CzcD-associated flavoprotein CzcO
MERPTMSEFAVPESRSARVRRLFGEPPANWVRATESDHDVVVVGGGQAGLGIGFALRRAGIARFSVIDAAAPDRAGGWTTTARMRTLRTPKAWPEPEFGFPELSFRAWYEQRHGPDAYHALDRIPRLDWAAYLRWITATIKVPVRHHTRLVRIAPAGPQLQLTLQVTAADGTRSEIVETTRQVVLANGVQSTGGPNLPAPLAGLPADLLAHTADAIDFGALAGRRVAVVGAGASALDAAGVALEAGADQVHLFVRRDELIVQGPGGFPPGSLGTRENFHRRSDADRWQLKVAAARAGRSCTLESVHRAAAFPGFRVHLASPWQRATVVGRQIHAWTPRGRHTFDFVIAGTGYQYDPHTRAELADLAADIALWRDVYTPPVELADEDLGRWPYLGPGYELTERRRGRSPWLGRIRVFSAAAALSFGLPVGDVASLATGIPRLVDAIGRDLFFEDQQLPPAAAAPAAAPPRVSYREHYEQAVRLAEQDTDLVGAVR